MGFCNFRSSWPCCRCPYPCCIFPCDQPWTWCCCLPWQPCTSSWNCLCTCSSSRCPPNCPPWTCCPPSCPSWARWPPSCPPWTCCPPRSSCCPPCPSLCTCTCLCPSCPPCTCLQGCPSLQTRPSPCCPLC